MLVDTWDVVTEQSFSGFNAKKMRVHLTGEEKAQTRAANVF